MRGSNSCKASNSSDSVSLVGSIFHAGNNDTHKRDPVVFLLSSNAADGFGLTSALRVKVRSAKLHAPCLFNPTQPHNPGTPSHLNPT